MNILVKCMVCEYYESCNLINRAPTIFILVKEYTSKFCRGGEEAECEHRQSLIKIEKLENKLKEIRGLALLAIEDFTK